MDCSPPGSSVHGDSPGKNTGVCCHVRLRGSSQPRGQTQFSHRKGDSLPSEPPGKLKNTLSLLQGIFVTQESNQGLLHCRWILYQLSSQAPSSIQKPRESLLLLGRDWKLPPNTHQTHPQGLDTEDLTRTEAEDWLGYPRAPRVTPEASITHRGPNNSCQWGRAWRETEKLRKILQSSLHSKHTVTWENHCPEMEPL